MSLDDVFGPRPGRPQHPDLAVLSEVVLQIDGKTEDRDFDMDTYLATLVDPESVSYVAFQRAIRMAAQVGDTSPALVAAIATVWIDGFLTGHGYHDRKS